MIESTYIVKVFVIVVTYNGRQWVDKCFGSLQNSNYAVTTIAVDNASSDDTVDLITKNYPAVQIISNTINAGFGKANNQGIVIALAAGAQYVLLLNQDAWIEPATIEKLITAFNRAPHYGIVSPLHYNGKGDALDYNFNAYLSKVYNTADIDLWKANKIETLFPIPFVNAAAWMISRKCLEETGGFGPVFFHYGEDYDFVQRMEFHGFTTAVLPAAKIYHDREKRGREALWGTWKKLVRYYYVGSLVRLANINKPAVSAIAYVYYWNLKEFVAQIFKGNLKAFFVSFEVFFKVTVSLPSMMAYRRQIKRKERFRFLS